MKLLIIFALMLGAANAADLPKSKLKSRSIQIPAGLPEGRVSNGQNAVQGQIPYQVGLLLQDYAGRLQWCGGSLLNNRKVLTAAHCTHGVGKGTAYLGSIVRYKPEAKRMFTSSDVITHPSWNNSTLENDISIINIAYVHYSSNIQSVQLPSTQWLHSSYSGKVVMASGWGRFSDISENIANILQYVHVYVMPNNVCDLYYKIPIMESNICIATYGGFSTCRGDSGGPLVLASTRIQIGITSFGATNGCQQNYPAVFTRITHYIDWIKENSKTKREL